MKKNKYFIIAIFVVFYFIINHGVVFGQSFNSIDRDDIVLKESLLSDASIASSELDEDKIIIYKTTISGYYGKFIVTKDPESDGELHIDYVTYNDTGDIHLQGSLELPLTRYVCLYYGWAYLVISELDLGSWDFHWTASDTVNLIDVELQPLNNALFAFYENNPPTADAGSNQTVNDSDNNNSEDVTLDGSGSTDADGTITSYVWSDGGQIATGATPTVTLSAGTHTITLTVTDNDGDTDTDTVTVKVNKLPTADAGDDQVVTDINSNGSEDVTLDGSGSTDSDGTIASYAWSEGGPIASGVNPTVNLSAGTHTITLTVTDNDGATDTDTVTITVNTPPDKPTNTLCDGKTSPADNVSDYTPLFSWSFSDDDAGDSQLAYQIIVGTSAGLSDIWDSGKVYSGVESASYTGSTNLLPNTTSLAIPYQYHWSVKVWDSNEGESVYSDDSTFVILDIGLRMFDGTSDVKIAVDYVDSTYELRVRRGGVTYGIILIDISDPDASNIRIKTANNGIRALKKIRD